MKDQPNKFCINKTIRRNTVLFVLAICGLLFIVLMEFLNEKSDREKKQAEKQQFIFKYFMSFIDLYYLEHDAFPRTYVDLENMSKDNEKTHPLAFNDIWGTRMIYTVTTNGVSIISAGPDKIFGTIDDVLTNACGVSHSHVESDTGGR